MSLKTKIVKFFNSRGHIAISRHGSRYSRIGDADIDVWLWYGGRQKIAVPIKIEVKRNKNDRPTQIQAWRAKEANDRGVESYVVWEMEQAKMIEESWMKRVESIFGAD